MSNQALLNVSHEIGGKGDPLPANLGGSNIAYQRLFVNTQEVKDQSVFVSASNNSVSVLPWIFIQMERAGSSCPYLVFTSLGLLFLRSKTTDLSHNRDSPVRSASKSTSPSGGLPSKQVRSITPVLAETSLWPAAASLWNLIVN